MPNEGEGVLLAVEDGIAVLTLNRPDSMNALSSEIMRLLERRLRALAAMPELRAAIITGTGRAFGAGGDLIEFEQKLRDGTLIDTLRYNQDVLQLVEDLPAPVIGAANGVALAGGLELLLCCDIILAAEGAKLGDGHARYGIVPAGGATVRLGERLSPSHAAQLFYTAATIDAKTLAEWGLVNAVVPAGELMPCAMRMAREIASRSPEAIRHIKALTRRDDAGRAARIRAELEHFAAHLGGEDLARGLAAFRQKQPIDY